MEHESLSGLGDLEEAAVTSEVKRMFSHHADETRHQIENLGRASPQPDGRTSPRPPAARLGRPPRPRLPCWPEHHQGVSCVSSRPSGRRSWSSSSWR